MHSHTIIREDGDGACISGFANTYGGVREVVKGVSFGSFGVKFGYGQSHDLVTNTYFAVSHFYMFLGFTQDRKPCLGVVCFSDVLSIGAGIVGDRDWFVVYVVVANLSPVRGKSMG